MVGLSETPSKNYAVVSEYVRNYVPTSVKAAIDPSVTDLSYSPDSTVKSIKQQQKILSEAEIQIACKRYQSGDSVYKLARDFGCHRSTISAVLKRNGVEVTHQASKKPELVKRVIGLYAEMKTPKEVGTIVGLDCGTVRQVLKDNGIYIRKAWEYPRK